MTQFYWYSDDKHAVKINWSYSLVYNNFPLFCGLQHMWRSCCKHQLITLIKHFLFGLQPRWRTCWSLTVSCPPITATSPVRWGSLPTLSYSSPTGVSHWTTWPTLLGSPMSSLTSECNFIVMTSFFFLMWLPGVIHVCKIILKIFFNHVYDIFTMYSTHDLFNQYSKKFNEKESKYLIF